MKTYKYKNITFNFTTGNVGDLSGDFTEEIALGWCMIDIPKKHIQDMKRDGYYKEVDYKGRTYKIPPHMEAEDYEADDRKTLRDINRDLYENINTDLQIVYFKWMLECPVKKFVIDVTGDNPYWLFHDIAHSKNDVHGSEVCCLSGSAEQSRLDQGIRIMRKEGYVPEFEEEYINKMMDSFWNRWRMKLNLTEFAPYIKEEEAWDSEE